MSGHSKWSKVKHQKATTDAVKGQAFTRAARAITIAVREGGGVGDPKSNFRLRLAIEKAREVNVPKENIERAIEKGLGAGGVVIEQITYEGYGPNGVAVLVETATDNKQRTVSVIKNYFDRADCSLAGPGAVSYLFTRCGVITVLHSQISFDAVFEAALEAGATDVVDTADVVEIYGQVRDISTIRERLAEKGIAVDTADIIMRPNAPVEYEDDMLKKIEAFTIGLESLDDVQRVYTNMV